MIFSGIRSNAFLENDQSLAMNKAFCEKMAVNDTI